MNFSDSIFISAGDNSSWAHKGALVIPDDSLNMQTMVQPVIPKHIATPKDVAFSLIQIALSGYEDNELSIKYINDETPIVTVRDGETLSCMSGLVVFWSDDGIKLWAHKHSQVDKLLKVAHRECTRWIRLDVK